MSTKLQLNQFLLKATLYVLNFCAAIPLLLLPMDSELDAYSRAEVLPFFESDIFQMHGSVWLPLYQTFISLAQFLPGPELLTTRILSLLVASFVPIVIFSLTKKLTGSSFSSFITALLYIIFPLFHQIGAATLSETFFLFLFLGALHNLLNHNYSGFSALMFLSQMTRFESWFAVPWLATNIVLLQKPSQIAKLIMIGSCVAFPVFYSILSYAHHGTGTTYVTEMKDMAELVVIEGRGNFAIALSRWSTNFWDVVPLSFVGLFLTGLGVFLQQKRSKLSENFSEQFVFAILPIFLLVMLPIQLFLPFRDWLPHRYILIPVTLLFPLIGLGIQSLLLRFTWKKFWQWYVLGVVFMGFELYSLHLTTNDFISAYTTPQFVELQQTLENQVKDYIAKQPNTLIVINNPDENNSGAPNLRHEFVKFFLLPLRPQVRYASQVEIPELLKQKSQSLIIITTADAQLTQQQTLTELFVGDHYQFLLAE